MATPTISHIRQQIIRASAYINGGSKNQLKKLLDGAVDMATIDKYINKIDDVKVNRTSIRFCEKMATLPDFKSFNAYVIYNAILNESTEAYSVQSLLQYSGIYQFDIPEEVPIRSGFTVLGIKVVPNQNTPFGGFAGFIFSYKSPSMKKRSANNKEISQNYPTDGFVFYRRDTIYFLGTAENTTFLAYVKKVKNPEHQRLEGRMVFECDGDNSFADTKFALVKRQVPLARQGSSA